MTMLHIYRESTTVNNSCLGDRPTSLVAIHTYEFTWNIHYGRACPSVTTNSSLADVLSSMGLVQRVDGEDVRRSTSIGHNEVSTSRNGCRAARPHPLHSGGTIESTGNIDITRQEVLLSKCWISTSSDRHQHCV